MEAQHNDQAQIALENVKLREQIAIMVEQAKLKDDLHAKQVRARKPHTITNAWGNYQQQTLSTHNSVDTLSVIPGLMNYYECM
jgi:glyoxylate carboligase